MKSRIARVGVLAAGLLALLGTTTPPAHADTIFSGAFVGTATVGSGLSYPCAGGGGVPPIDLSLCPTGNALLVTLPLNGITGLIPNGHIDFHHNKQPVAVSSILCVGAGAQILKDPKPPVAAGLCGFGVAGTVAGHCGLSGGQVSGNFNDGSVLGPQNYTVDVHFNGIASVIVFTGHYTKVGDPSNHGLLIGVTLAVPVPTTNGTPTLGNSCSNKSATAFTLVGAVAGIPDPQLI